MSEKKQVKKFEAEKQKFLILTSKLDQIKLENNPKKNDKISENNTITNKSKEKYTIKIEINKTDTIELIKLPGIGSILSRRIIKYREVLGGFYSINQILEVYGINNDLLRNIRDYIIVDSTSISLLDINNADFKLINSHPYISYEQTKAIFNLRYSTKRNINRENLKKAEIFDSVGYSKIIPYLKFK